jgi:hypothetical protein
MTPETAASAIDTAHTAIGFTAHINWAAGSSNARYYTSALYAFPTLSHFSQTQWHEHFFAVPLRMAVLLRMQDANIKYCSSSPPA